MDGDYCCSGCEAGIGVEGCGWSLRFDGAVVGLLERRVDFGSVALDMKRLIEYNNF